MVFYLVFLFKLMVVVGVGCFVDVGCSDWSLLLVYDGCVCLVGDWLYDMIVVSSNEVILVLVMYLYVCGVIWYEVGVEVYNGLYELFVVEGLLGLCLVNI